MSSTEDDVEVHFPQNGKIAFVQEQTGFAEGGSAILINNAGMVRPWYYDDIDGLMTSCWLEDDILFIAGNANGSVEVHYLVLG